MKKWIIIFLALVLLASSANAATLQVDSHHYKTIQKAVNAAHNGDIVKVSPGTYPEKVVIADKAVKILGSKYPKVYGFIMNQGQADINGFTITKYGIDDGYSGGYNTFRNNYFYNTGVDISGAMSSYDTIINNQFYNCNFGVRLYDTWEHTITGNLFSGCSTGVHIGDASTVKSVTKNIFKNCGIGVMLYYLPDGLIGNKYQGCKQNLVYFNY